MGVRHCSQYGCEGHISKFDSCLDEVLYELSMSDADDTCGDTDWHAHYAYVRVPNGETLDYEWIAGGEPVTVPAGYYIVMTHSSGLVVVDRFGTELLAEEAWMPLVAQWERASRSCDECGAPFPAHSSECYHVDCDSDDADVHGCKEVEV